MDSVLLFALIFTFVMTFGVKIYGMYDKKKNTFAFDKNFMESYKNKENKKDVKEGYTNNSPNISSYYYNDPTSLPQVQTNIMGGSFKNSKKNFGNFGKFGVIPMMQYCSECQLYDNCLTPDYRESDKNMNVCQKCNNNLKNKNYHDFNKPIYVFAKSIGRPRKCKRIN